MSNKIWFACLKQLQHYWSVWAAAKPRLPLTPPLSNFIQNVNIPFSLPSDSSAGPLSQHFVLLSFWRVNVGLTTWLWTGLHPSALPCGTRQRHSVTKKPGTCQEFRQPITLFVVLYVYMYCNTIGYHSKFKTQTSILLFLEQSSLQCLFGAKLSNS